MLECEEVESEVTDEIFRVAEWEFQRNVLLRVAFSLATSQRMSCLN
jgi:hypothetical protein